MRQLSLSAWGRIRLPVNPGQWLAQAKAPLQEAPFTDEIGWPPNNCHCRTATPPTGFKPLQFWS